MPNLSQIEQALQNESKRLEQTKLTEESNALASLRQQLQYELDSVLSTTKAGMEKQIEAMAQSAISHQQQQLNRIITNTKTVENQTAELVKTIERQNKQIKKQQRTIQTQQKAMSLSVILVLTSLATLALMLSLAMK